MDELEKRVDAAVRTAEERTSAEIVPVLAFESGDYRGAAYVAGALAALLGVAVLLVWPPFPVGDWGATLSWPLAAPGLFVLFAVGWLFGRFEPTIRRAFTTRRRMRAEVERAARDALETLRVRDTENATGVVIYVSEFEHMVRIEGDAAVAEAGFDWTAVCDAVVAELKRGRLAEAFEAGVERAGTMLAEALPAEGDNPDELHNGLRIVD
jgi:putative membrane protein